MKKPNTSTSSNLDSRLEFMELDSRRCEAIRRIKPIVERELPNGLEKFYARLRATPEVSRFFDNASHIARAKSAQEGHWSAISSAKFDTQYAEKVDVIGSTHARIGLEPRWYIGGYAIILEHLIKSIVAEVWPKGMIVRTSGSGSKEAGEAIASLAKAVLLDMDLAISVYIDEAEKARLKAEDEAIARERDLVSQSIGVAMSKLASKDLTVRLNDGLPDAYRELQSNFNGAVAALEQAIASVKAEMESMKSGTDEIAAASDNLSNRAQSQAASLEETAAAVQQISTTVRATADGAEDALRTVSTAKSNAEQSKEVVEKAVGAMNDIETSSEEINEISHVIDEIAFQTNLLALNAGVEAARAGEAGRGFAVVASEVRALAQRSADAAKRIGGLISTSSSQVEKGVSHVGETGETLGQIITGVADVSEVVSKIASGTKEQATGLQEINTAVNQMDQMTQENAAMAEQATAATQTLAQQSDRLVQLVSGFNTSGSNVEDHLRSSLKKAVPHVFASHEANQGSATIHAEAISARGSESARRRAAGGNSKGDWEEF